MSDFKPPLTRSGEVHSSPVFLLFFHPSSIPHRLRGAIGPLRFCRRPLSEAAVNENLATLSLFQPCRRPDAPMSSRHSLLAQHLPHDSLILRSPEKMLLSHPLAADHRAATPTLRAVIAAGARPCRAMWSGRPGLASGFGPLRHAGFQPGALRHVG
jgi:hypothetical protein